MAGESAEDSTDFRSTWRSLAQNADPQNAFLTALNGRLVGRTYCIGSGRIIVGRAEDCDIVLNDDGVSRRHALLVARPDGNVVVEDLRSTNGSMVNGTLCTVLPLKGGERIQFGSKTVFKFEFRDAIEEQYATYLYESATQDRLTGMFNERYLREQLNIEYAWHQRHELPLSIIFLDIDHFKAVNDEFGHLSGDEVLRQIAKRCHLETRAEDIFARYGGEEFACLLRRTPLAAATIIADRMRRSVAHTSFWFKYGESRAEAALTLSAGVVEMSAKTATPDGLLAEADRLLYEAKHAGRNQVVPAPLANA
jgi:two-component system cell cycle response regulator